MCGIMSCTKRQNVWNHVLYNADPLVSWCPYALSPPHLNLDKHMRPSTQKKSARPDQGVVENFTMMCRSDLGGGCASLVLCKVLKTFFRTSRISLRNITNRASCSLAGAVWTKTVYVTTMVYAKNKGICTKEANVNEQKKSQSNGM